MQRILPTLLVCLLAAFVAPAGAWAAGLRSAVIPAAGEAPALKIMVWTPCAAPAQELRVGPYLLKGVRGCPVSGSRLPLVVISHGHGGSKLGHHDLAEALADAGFVVAALDHPGDNFADMSRAADFAEFAERPADIERLINYLLTAAPEAARIDAGRIGFFGFSRGGYTGLVLAGGEPDFLHADVPCPDPNLPICTQIRRKLVPALPLPHDARIKAYVLADPLNEFPAAADLAKVTAPIQLWASQYGGDGVLPETEPALAAALPRRPDFHAVAGAAHFAFIAPCSPALIDIAPAICRDAGDFDRAAFHREMDAQALAFFKARLGE